jgi:autotransporter-associated beta strand protein
VGTYVTNANGNFNFNVTNPTGNLTVTRTNFNYNGLNKYGAGTLTLTGLPGVGYDCGDVSVYEGTLILAANGVNAGVDWCNVGSVLDVAPGATVKLGNSNGGNVFYQYAFNMSGGTFDVNGQNPALWKYSSLPTISGTGTITNSSAVASTIPFSTWNGNKTFSGNIVDGTGTVGVNLYLSGNTWTLSGNNTYSGPTTITNGTLRAGSTTAFSPNSAYTVAGGKTLDLAGFDNSIGSLTGSGSVTLGSAELTIGNDGTGTSFTGVISGTDGSVVKVGSGTLTLTNNNTYTGSTTVSDGTLILSGANAYAGATLINAGTLQANHASALGSGGDITFGGGTLQFTAASAGQDWAARIKNRVQVVLCSCYVAAW